MAVTTAAAPGLAPAPPPASAAAVAEALNRSVHAGIGGLTGGLSPAAMALAWFDRALQGAISPCRQLCLAGLGLDLAARFLAHAARREVLPPDWAEPAFRLLPGGRRFAEKARRRFPCDMAQQSFLMTKLWWHEAATGQRGMTRSHAEVVAS